MESMFTGNSASLVLPYPLPNKKKKTKLCKVKISS